jgi:hypothetical protein
MLTLSYLVNSSITTCLVFCCVNACIVLSSCFLLARDEGGTGFQTMWILTTLFLIWTIPAVLMSVAVDRYSYYHGKLVKDISVSDYNQIVGTRHTAFEFKDGKFDLSNRVLYTKEVRTHHHYTRMNYHFIPIFRDLAPLDPAPEKFSMWLVHSTTKESYDPGKFSRKLVKMQHTRLHQHMLLSKLPDRFKKGKVILLEDNTYEEMKTKISVMFIIGSVVLGLMTISLLIPLIMLTFNVVRKKSSTVYIDIDRPQPTAAVTLA